ncbi:MAG: SDR family NAD(P)-dependent oxidoreductase [Pseudomonadota bacterium]
MISLDSFDRPVHALIQGASRGIGLGLVQALLAESQTRRVIATCRQPDRADALQALSCERLIIHRLDATLPDQYAGLTDSLSAHATELNLIINAAGMLHTEHVTPEKKLEDVDSVSMQRVFALNAIAPILLIQALRPLMARQGKVVFAALSARVGSIADNRLGGWYSYRSSKAALNQLLRTASIELKRRNPNVIVAALHPGTTDTDLSKPFQSRVPADRLFSVDRTSTYLLNVINHLSAADSGGFFAWDGQAIDW